ncbi:hypothetical protein AZF37_03935 [endosymbiont 'TC1' of Trimyema compressum]|uniref:putative polysaccharide biosynthesis protein n=1 Tax=endosymbiont 'TC1' of Trimyema compressum TaxID=243899 RepID=UPI0007F0A7B0|nr:oligosaccharide flippase family protein [endosymbiont 'TC1' of Trimyema compressum]AMP20433.1 hypothetical protein AZF37_03935 [endosymbiont 'TC1' of Trimyema compressum]
MDNSKENLMLKNAFILSFAAILSKVVGAVYQIFLYRVIGAEGSALYAKGIAFYAMLLAVSAAGISIAISKLMSEEIAKGNTGIAFKIFKVASLILGIIGIVLSVGLFFGAPYIASNFYVDPNVTWIIQATAPALLVVTFMAAFRGYFQGQQNMGPTAYSQIFEQLGRIVFSVAITLVYIYFVAGTNLSEVMGVTSRDQSLVQSIADGVALGPFVGAIIGFLPIIYFYYKRKNSLNRKITYGNRQSRREATTGYLTKRILLFAIPVTLAALLPTLIDMADATLIPNVLMGAGLSYKAANASFGYFTNTAMILVNIIILAASSFAASLVPAIADARGRKNDQEVKNKTALSIKLVTLISLPAAASMFLLSKPIVALIFNEVDNDVYMVLQASVFMILFMSIYHSTTGVLQGVGKIYVPLVSLFAGLLVNIGLLNLLLPIKGLNILGAPIAHTVAYFTAAIINFIAVKRIVGYRSKWLTWLPQGLLSALITGAIAYGVYRLFNLIIGFINEGILNLLISLIFAVIAGIIVYFITLVLFRAIKEDEVKSIPKIGFIFGKIFKRIRRS